MITTCDVVCLERSEKRDGKRIEGSYGNMDPRLLMYSTVTYSTIQSDVGVLVVPQTISIIVIPGNVPETCYVDGRLHVGPFLNGLPGLSFRKTMFICIYFEPLKTSYFMFRLFHALFVPRIYPLKT